MQHHVYFWLKDENKNEADRNSFEKGMEQLLKIENIASGIWGKSADTPERPVTDKSFDYALSLTFDSVEEHNIYQNHAEHHVFVDAYKNFWASAKVMDVG